MAFGFFKMIKEAIQEGLAEAKAELAEEEAAKKAVESEKEAARQALWAELREKTARLSPVEIFHVSLGAPLREIFVGDLSEASGQNRPPYYSLAMDVPPEKTEEIKKNLERDFGITDRDSLLSTAIGAEAAVWFLMQSQLLPDPTPAVEDLALAAREEAPAPLLLQKLPAAREEGVKTARETMSEKHTSLLALWMTRIAYMATAAAGVGHTSKEEALMLVAGLVQAGFPRFRSWAEYGEAFLQGEAEDGTNMALGRMLLKRQVNRLLSEEQSPWITHPWPTAPEQ